MNPARDFGPRILSAMITSKKGLKYLVFSKFIFYYFSAFTDGNYFFWIPVIGPLVAGVLGAGLYNGVDSLAV